MKNWPHSKPRVGGPCRSPVLTLATLRARTAAHLRGDSLRVPDRDRRWRGVLWLYLMSAKHSAEAVGMVVTLRCSATPSGDSVGRGTSPHVFPPGGESVGAEPTDGRSLTSGNAKTLNSGVLTDALSWARPWAVKKGRADRAQGPLRPCSYHL